MTHLGTVSALLILVAATGCGNRTEVAIPLPDTLGQVAEPRLTKAVEDARRDVHREPRSAQRWGRLGNVYVIHGWDADAADCYRQAIELQPNEFRWRYYLGRSLGKLHPEEAADAFASAISLDPKYAPAYVYSAQALRKLGRFDEAKLLLEQAAELDQRNPFVWLHLGELALAERQFKVALDHLQKAVSLNPEQSEAHAALAKAYMALGDKPTALQHVQAAAEPSKITPMRDDLWGEVQLEGRTIEWFAKRGNYYLRRGEIDRALTELEVALSGEQRDPELWMNYGVALLHRKRHADARNALERAIKEAGDDAGHSEIIRKKMTPSMVSKIHVNLGTAATKLGDVKAAEQSLKEASRLNPDSYEAAYNLAILYHSQERREETIEALRKCQQIRDDPKVAAMINTLSRQNRPK